MHGKQIYYKAVEKDLCLIVLADLTWQPSIKNAWIAMEGFV